MEANGRSQGGEGPCSWIWAKLRRHWWLLLTLAAVMLFLDIETGKTRAQIVARSSQETVRKVLDGLQQQIGAWVCASDLHLICLLTGKKTTT